MSSHVLLERAVRRPHVDAPRLAGRRTLRRRFGMLADRRERRSKAA